MPRERRNNFKTNQDLGHVYSNQRKWDKHRTRGFHEEAESSSPGSEDSSGIQSEIQNVNQIIGDLVCHSQEFRFYKVITENASKQRNDMEEP